MISYFDFCVFFFLTENLSSDSALSSPSSLNSPGLVTEGLNRRRKKRTSIETNIRVALEKSFSEVSEVFTFHVLGTVCELPALGTVSLGPYECLERSIESKTTWETE